MTERITIAVDAMSGDKGPAIVVAAALNYLQKNKASKIILVGDRDQLEALLSDSPVNASLLIHHAPDIVGMDEKPSLALRKKQNSSMAVALQLVRDKIADACVSAGNTGALMMLGRLTLGMYPGIDRPAITKYIQGPGGGCYVLDLGANVDCSAEHLLQFAVMGSVLSEILHHNAAPKVALLNIGEESMKGNEQVRLASTLLAESEQFNYVGYIEGGDIFNAQVDVVVCDGFVGNVALKSGEGVAKQILSGVYEIVNRAWYTRLIGKMLYPLFAGLLERFNPDNHNGAIFLGMQGVLVKSHGNASARSFEIAIEHAAQEACKNLPELLNQRLEMIL
jgi:glycerol-3-phosphate acyltransferase PlsX